MSELSSILSNLHLKEDLFKSVTYIVTGDLNEKVSFFFVIFSSQHFQYEQKKNTFYLFFWKILFKTQIFYLID